MPRGTGVPSSPFCTYWYVRSLAGRDAGELARALDPAATAVTIVAVLQGGYVLARAAGDTDPFEQAVSGALGLLSAYVLPGVGEAAEPLSRTIVLDQTLPAALATRRVEARRIRIAAGHAAGLHVHNGPVFGSIEAGSAVYQIEGEPASVLTPGDTFYEPAGVRIARFDARESGVTFLAYFPLTDGQSAELSFPDA
ncbi:MAG TPA: hypothetical protein VGN37_03110 [Actinocatenispora sp.]